MMIVRNKNSHGVRNLAAFGLSFVKFMFQRLNLLLVPGEFPNTHTSLASKAKKLSCRPQFYRMNEHNYVSSCPLSYPLFKLILQPSQKLRNSFRKFHPLFNQRALCYCLQPRNFESTSKIHMSLPTSCQLLLL